MPEAKPATLAQVSAAFAEPFLIDGVEHFITASLGIAVARPSTREPADPDMLIRADNLVTLYRTLGGDELIDAMAPPPPPKGRKAG